MRLDKYLTKTGLGKRKEVKDIIKQKQITVNGNIISQDQYQVSTNDIICYQEKQLIYEEYVYYMMNKPAGYVCATKDNLHPTVLSLIDDDTRELSLVGRLDIDTEGLLLITDDGEFIHQVTSPKKAIKKKYFVKYEGVLIKNAVEIILKGQTLADNEKMRPAILELLDDNTAYITLTEGKFHEVKRLFLSIGGKVIYLKREQIGNLVLDDNLKLGEYKKLSNKEKDLITL